MVNLQEEYTDLRDVRHRVEHLVREDGDDGSRERVIQELFHTLTKTDKRVSA